MAKVNMKDVAKAAGVSVMTVSLALRRHPRIPEATAGRVREIAEQMGYRVDPLASAFAIRLRSQYKVKALPVIGYLVTHPERRQWWESGLTRAYYEGAKARCKELGFGFELFEPVISEIPFKRLSEILRYRNICGLICAPIPQLGMAIDLDWSAFPAVVLGTSIKDPVIHRVSPNHYQSMVFTLKYLTELGYKRIGVVNSRYAEQRTLGLYLAAYRNFQSTLPDSQCVPIMYLSNVENWRKEGLPEYWLAEVQAWIREYKPDAVIDAQFNTLDKLLREGGASLPPGCAHVTLSWSPRYGHIAGIDQNSHLVGKVGVDTLVSQIYANERGVPSTQIITLVNGKWVDTPSVPDLRATV